MSKSRETSSAPPPCFVKHDQGKARFSLVPCGAEVAMARVFTKGAAKYSDENWKLASTDEGIKRYYDAARRHLDAIHAGVLFDEELGEQHAAALMANAAMLYWFIDQDGSAGV